MAKLALLIAVLLVSMSIGRVQAQALQPCESQLFDDYYQRIDKIIDDATGHTPQLSLIVLPSFLEESGVRLVGADVYFVQFKSFLWAAANSYDNTGRGHMDFFSPDIKTKTYRSSISPEIASRIEQIYAKAILGATKSERPGFDGTTFRFSEPNVGCGEAWSPDANSPNGRLVKLLQLLAEHAQLSSPRDMQRSEMAIVRLLNSISTEDR